MSRFVAPSPEASPRQMLALAAAVNAALRGDCANTGLLDVPAGTAEIAVADARCRTGRLALLVPLDAAAASVRWHLAAMERGAMRFGFDAVPQACRFGWLLAGQGVTAEKTAENPAENPGVAGQN